MTILKEIKHGLVGLEIKETDLRILQYLRFFTSILPLHSLTFLHVLRKPDVYIPFTEAFPIRINEGFDEKEIQESTEALEKEVEDLFPVGTRVSCMTMVGSPLAALAQLSKDIQADMVVLGKNVESRKHMILAKNLVRQVKAHTLMIPGTAQPVLKKILVPIDFSENSRRALEVALSLQERTEQDIEVIVLNIYQKPNLLPYRISMTPDQFQENIKLNHLRGFNKFMDASFPDHVGQVTPLLVQSDKPDVGYQILDRADHVGADMIVMGSRGHSAIELLLLGSTTETVLHSNTTIPTLVVK